MGKGSGVWHSERLRGGSGTTMDAGLEVRLTHVVGAPSERCRIGASGMSGAWTGVGSGLGRERRARGPRLEDVAGC
jgi:hypothetical protein